MGISGTYQQHRSNNQVKVEGTQENGAIPFLHTLITLLADNFLSITVHHKPTHTDEYLQ